MVVCRSRHHDNAYCFSERWRRCHGSTRWSAPPVGLPCVLPFRSSASGRGGTATRAQHAYRRANYKCSGRRESQQSSNSSSRELSQVLAFSRLRLAKAHSSVARRFLSAGSVASRELVECDDDADEANALVCVSFNRKKSRPPLLVRLCVPVPGSKSTVSAKSPPTKMFPERSTLMALAESPLLTPPTWTAHPKLPWVSSFQIKPSYPAGARANVALPESKSIVLLK